MTVHGEREMLPAVTKAEADKALRHFTDAFNKNSRALDPKANTSYEAGAMLGIDQAGMKASQAAQPQGRPNAPTVTLEDARYTVPKQAGWPKYFLADAVNSANGAHWLLAFSRDDLDEPWRAVYWAQLRGQDVPEFASEGAYGEAVPDGAKSELKVAPDELSARYADFLNTGEGDLFASGPHTDHWRSYRAKVSNQAGQRIQWKDQEAKFPPVALRTKDGGALVFFASYYHQQKTVFEGATLKVSPQIRAIMDGPVKKTNKMAFTTLTGQVAKVPAKGSSEQVTILSRVEAKTSAKAL